MNEERVGLPSDHPNQRVVRRRTDGGAEPER